MKIAILGVGRVGTATAFALVMQQLGHEIVLIGRDLRKAEGEAADLQDAAGLHSRASVRAALIDDAGALEGVDVAIVTNSAGFGGASRLDELAANAPMFRELIPKVVARSPGVILVIVSNPVDAMTYLAIQYGGLPASRVIGTGTLIDTMRFRAALAAEWRMNPLDVRAYILGEHGDSQFAALSVASAGGVKFDADDAFVIRAAEAARTAGRDLVDRKGYTNFAVASSTATIVEAICDDSRAVLPVSTRIDGYLGVRDVCLSVPCVVGREGILRMLPVDLDDAEAEAFRNSARVLRGALASVGA